MSEPVLNPSPVPIRLGTPAIGAYLKLRQLLESAADQASQNAAELPTATADWAEWLAVRDALRRAAGEAMVPRGGNGIPRCRRCGTDCVECSPPAAEVPPPAILVELALDGYGVVRHLLPQPDLRYAVGIRADDAPAAILAGRPTELTGTVRAQVQR